MTRILALDISASPGYAVLEVNKNKRINLLHVDSVKTDAKSPDSERYAYIEAKTVQIVHEYGPFDAVCREHFVKGRSKRATQLVFGAWAAVDSALGRYGYAIDAKDEYSPTAVKKAATGDGKADKDAVEDGVRHRLGLLDDFVFKTDDASDAVAVGLTYIEKEGLIG